MLLPTLLLIPALGLAGPAPNPQDTGLGWRLERIDLELVLLPEEGALEMNGTMRVRLAGEPSLGPSLAIAGKSKALRLVSLGVPGEAGDGATVELDARTPVVPGLPVANVRFDHPLPTGSELELSFEAVSQGRGSQFLVEERIAFGSWTDAWHPLPVFDRATESLSSQLVAIGTTTFHLPPGWESACNGKRVAREVTEDGVREVWDLTQPLARSFAAGPFHSQQHTAGGLTVTVSRLRDTGGAFDMHAVAAAASVNAMADRLGPYPYEDFHIVEVPRDVSTWSAASQQGMIFATETCFGYEDGNIALFAHEMGHGWWGNLVGVQGPGALLCGESLAQYGCVIALEALEDEAAATEFLRFSRPGYSPTQSARGFFGLWAAGSARPLAILDSTTPYDHDLSDAKGHWVYHMLRRRVGDEVFFATLRGLIETYSNRLLSLDAIRAAFREAAPEAGLEVFFEQWFERTGAPILDVEWAPAGAGEVAVEIHQTQSEEPYHLRLDLDLSTSAGTTRHRVAVTERDTRVVLPAAGEVKGVVLDPDHRLLIWKPEYGARPE